MLRAAAAVVGHRAGLTNDRYASDARYAGQVQEGRDLVVAASLVLVDLGRVIIRRQTGVGSVRDTRVVRVIDLDKVKVDSAVFITTDRLQVGKFAKTGIQQIV